MTILEGIRELVAPAGAGKALAPTSAREPEPAIFASSNNTRVSVRKAFDHLSVYAGEEAVDWAYDCVTLIYEALAGAEYHFEREGERLVTELLSDDPSDASEAPADLIELLRRPNPYVTWRELLSLLIIDWLLIGNAFWYRFKPDAAGKPAALYRLMPQYLEIIPGKNKLIDHYEYRPPGKQPVAFPADRVIHFRRPSPHSEFVGAGVVKAGARVFDMELALTQTQTEYFEQGTRLSGVLESDRGVPDSVWRKIKGQFSALYAGAKNSYKVAMLSHGLKFKPIQATAAEAEFRFLAPMSRDRILAMFRVPGPLLGITGGYDRQAVREAQRIFDNKTVRPIADSLQEVISLALTQAWGVDFKIDYEYVMPIEDQLELAVDFASLPGVQVFEVREKAGLKPLGDERDNIVLNLPGEDDNASTVKDRGLGSEPGRPPDPANTAAFPEPGRPLPANAAARKAEKGIRDLKSQLSRIEGKLEGVAS